MPSSLAIRNGIPHFPQREACPVKASKEVKDLEYSHLIKNVQSFSDDEIRQEELLLARLPVDRSEGYRDRIKSFHRELDFLQKIISLPYASKSAYHLSCHLELRKKSMEGNDAVKDFDEDIQHCKLFFDSFRKDVLPNNPGIKPLFEETFFPHFQKKVQEQKKGIWRQVRDLLGL